MTSRIFRDCRGLRATDMAVLVDIPGVGQMWIPQSVIDDDSEVYGEGHAGRLVVSGWWAERIEEDGE